MEKQEFISKLAKRVDVKPDAIEQIVDTTLAEVVAPGIFVQPGQARRQLSDNNCNNNCAAELARQSPVRTF